MEKLPRFHSFPRFTFFLTLAAVCALPFSAVMAAGPDNRCEYSSRLVDPQARQKHLDMKAEMELVARIRKENLEAGTSRLSPDELVSFRELDEHSKNCISCHEGKGKMAVREIIQAYYPDRGMMMSSIYATHAIGTDYVAASIRNSGLHSIEELPPTMTLASGRIACITCHDPLNQKKNGLAVETGNGALCFACHRF
jgi:predicted CXXCH cytochrome family protein